KSKIRHVGGFPVWGKFGDMPPNLSDISENPDTCPQNLSHFLESPRRGVLKLSRLLESFGTWPLELSYMSETKMILLL
ncbi:MAG: hypothetical protein LBI58_00430, partial [Tannerellaceae bacterium]|nr:hypothetical protein [Tannerellaceae bacterium]